MSTRREFIGGVAGGVLASCALLRADPAPLEPELAALEQWIKAGAPVEEARRQFLLDPGIAYFNTGSVGACPRVVVEAHCTLLRQVESNPMFTVFGDMGAHMEEVRRKLAVFLGADVNEIAIVDNATTAMNMVADSLALAAGDEVLTSTQEHHGGTVGWEHARARRGIVIREVALPTPAHSTDELLAAIKAGITARTKVISLSHVNTITGLRLPVAEVAKLAAACGAKLIVDGAQAPGMLRIDLHALGCDAYAASCHKWMLGPKGCGFLYLRNGFREQVPAVALHGGMGVYTGATGTRNVPQVLALGTTLDFHQAVGIERIEERALGLARYLRHQLETIAGLEIASPTAPELHSALTTVKLPAGNAEGVVADLLKKHGIVVKPVPGEHLQNRGLRISTHLYNSQGEIDRFVEVLRGVVRAA